MQGPPPQPLPPFFFFEETFSDLHVKLIRHIKSLKTNICTIFLQVSQMPLHMFRLQRAIFRGSKFYICSTSISSFISTSHINTKQILNSQWTPPLSAVQIYQIQGMICPHVTVFRKFTEEGKITHVLWNTIFEENLLHFKERSPSRVEEYFQNLRALLRSWRSTLPDSSMRNVNLNWRGKKNGTLKFPVKAGFVCDTPPTTVAVLTARIKVRPVGNDDY
jgi:hypothetical protein